MPQEIRCWRRKFLISLVTLCCLAVLFALLLIVASFRASIPVTGEYYLFRVDSTSVVLCDTRGLVVVGEQIQELGVTGTLIVGRTIDPGVYASASSSFPIGYFAVDTTTRIVNSGMSYSQLVKHLGSVPPALKNPSCWAIWSW